MKTPALVFLIVLALGIAALFADRAGLFGDDAMPVTPFRVLAVALVAAGTALFFSRG